MPFNAQVLRVLIASPSDLSEERDAATNAINEWNTKFSASESIVLLPVKWETHARPQAGIHPQQAINNQLVKDSDILVGLFWTKIGTKTPVAESGTVEEIKQFVDAGKQALLYFSSRPIDPSKIDEKQYKKLKAFKKTTFKTALCGNFSTVDELRHTLVHHLSGLVRDIKATDPANKPVPEKEPVWVKCSNCEGKRRKHHVLFEHTKPFFEYEGGWDHSDIYQLLECAGCEFIHYHTFSEEPNPDNDYRDTHYFGHKTYPEDCIEIPTK
jgi:hypothetical protein